MIVALPILLFALAFVVTLVARIRSIEGGRHARCLANTARLEHELGIGLVPKSDLQRAIEKVEGYEIKPGAVWRVDDPDAIRWMNEARSLLPDMQATAQAITHRRRPS